MLICGISCDSLGSTFSAATALFKVVLSHDLSEDRLKDSRFWDRARDHGAIQRMIPLPASNSTPAKRMRTIAGLAIFSRALENFVFQPSYLSVGSDMKQALDALPGANLDQDSFVRAVLLKVLPDQQNICRDMCAERVADEVVAALSGWVPADEHATFKSRLGHITRDLCVNWQRVQKLHERVEPSFVFETLDDWKPLPTLLDPLPSSNGVEVTPPHHGRRDSQPGPQELAPVTLTTTEVLKVVWPAFLATTLEQPADDEESTSDLVHHGYVLTRADTEGAANEEMPRRAMRRATRESRAASQRTRRDSAVFLSHGASDGSPVK